MGKVFLIAATCLLAMSIGTLLVEGAKPERHLKKNAAHLKTKAGHEGPSGEELYIDATALVTKAEECLASFNTQGKHVSAAKAVQAASKKLDTVIKKLIKSHPKHPKSPKAGEVSITQQFELGDKESHSFDGHKLSQKTLKDLEKAAKEVSKEAQKLEKKPTLEATEKTKFHEDVQKLIGKVEEMESELGIKEILEEQEESEFDFFDGNDPEE